MKTIGVLLSGNGVYDGSELQETAFTLAAIDRHGAAASCMAPDVAQVHVIDHRTGAEMAEQRNVLVESARIARGAIRSLADVTAADIDALVIPGGFGTAKHLTSWAVDGAKATIDPHVQCLIVDLVRGGKPVVGLCMGPTVIARALAGSGVQAHLTVGTTDEPSPYDIKAIGDAMEELGARVHASSVRDITIDASNHLISAPCYMMETTPSAVQDNVDQAINALFAMLQDDEA